MVFLLFIGSTSSSSNLNFLRQLTKRELKRGTSREHRQFRSFSSVMAVQESSLPHLEKEFSVFKQQRKTQSHDNCGFIKPKAYFSTSYLTIGLNAALFKP